MALEAMHLHCPLLMRQRYQVSTLRTRKRQKSRRERQKQPKMMAKEHMNGGHNLRLSKMIKMERAKESGGLAATFPRRSCPRRAATSPASWPCRPISARATASS